MYTETRAVLTLILTCSSINPNLHIAAVYYLVLTLLFILQLSLPAPITERWGQLYSLALDLTSE